MPREAKIIQPASKESAAPTRKAPAIYAELRAIRHRLRQLVGELNDAEIGRSEYHEDITNGADAAADSLSEYQ